MHFALHEIGVPFEARPVSLGETRTPAFLALNPAGKVPTLWSTAHPSPKSEAACHASAKRFPQARLLPRDDVAAATSS